MEAAVSVEPVAEGMPLKHRLYKLAKTGLLTACYACTALTFGVGSIGLPSLRGRLGFTVAEMSRAFSIRNLGAMVGTLTAGVMTDRYSAYNDLLVACPCALAAVMFAAQPWVYNLHWLALLYFIQGCGEGSLDPVLSFAVFNLWGMQADTPMYCLHFGWVVGYLIAPSIVGPFLTPLPPVATDSWNITNSTLPTTSTQDHVTTMLPTTALATSLTPGNVTDLASNDTMIQYAYLIVAAYFLLMTVIFLVFHSVGSPTGMKLHMPKSETFRQVFHPGSCAAGHTCFSVFMVAMLMLYYFFGDGSLNYYLYSYTVESDLAFSQDHALRLETITRASSVGCRVLIIVISPFIPVTILLFVLLGLKLVNRGLLAFWGAHTKDVYFVLCITKAIITTPLFPMAKIFASKFMVVTALVVSLTIIGDNLGMFAFDFIMGQLYDTSKVSVLYCSFVHASITAVVVLVMYIVARRHLIRHPAPDAVKSDDDVDENIENQTRI